MHRRQHQRAAWDDAKLLESFRRALARGDLPQDPQVDEVARGERKRIPKRQRPFPPDEREVCDRQQQSKDLDRVLILELDVDELSPKRCGDEIDHWPAEADQQT